MWPAERECLIEKNEHQRGAGTSRLRAAKSSTATTCSRVTPNHSMMSSIVAPDSRFSKTVDTGMRVPRKTHAPLTLPGTLSTAGHCDQSIVAIATSVKCDFSTHRCAEFDFTP